MKVLRQSSLSFSKDIQEFRSQWVTKFFHDGDAVDDLIFIGFSEVLPRQLPKFGYVTSNGLDTYIGDMTPDANGIFIYDLEASYFPSDSYISIFGEWFEDIGGFNKKFRIYSEPFIICSEINNNSLVRALNSNNCDGIYNGQRFSSRFPLKKYKFIDIQSNRSIFNASFGREILLNSQTFEVYNFLFGSFPRHRANLLKYYLYSKSILIDNEQYTLLQGSIPEIIDVDLSDICYLSINLVKIEENFDYKGVNENPFDEKFKIVDEEPIPIDIWAINDGKWLDIAAWKDRKTWDE